jgi:hypothetical protein
MLHRLNFIARIRDTFLCFAVLRYHSAPEIVFCVDTNNTSIHIQARAYVTERINA